MSARRQVLGGVTGLGCGVVILVLTAAPLALVWLVLRWAGADVPSLSGVLDGPPAGAGWLVLSTLAAIAVLVVGAGLVAWMFLSDQVPSPAPWRLYLAWLVPLLPIVSTVSLVAAWICYAAGQTETARLLATGPWIAGLGLAAVSALLYSALVAYDR
ncbi:hypothetical protein GCM10010168_49140 [Actinoplanes ianthinogenes]|uniref:Uncharacterized protein n=1 Tax=Actinoplanes ianthinogenes TaxID=122358 RepID=A0ABM7M2U4_9ACTN|nr:hypothetical protein [Actinoplanes ianthinogenes]BCJ45966.1 hypothetical protein Aiant_66230 [Actinoplanes ianthinogenes]GGR25437.1 hypothetical protein GCM10010168_49140 [Actinoplanes ianthinogenes]